MLTPALCPAFVLPKAEICVRNHVQPYISSILEALMTPTSQGFAEVREVFFKEVTDMNMNIVNEGGLEKLVEVSAACGSAGRGSGWQGQTWGQTPRGTPGWGDARGRCPWGGAGCWARRGAVCGSPGPAEPGRVPSTWRSCPTWPSTR